MMHPFGLAPDDGEREYDDPTEQAPEIAPDACEHEFDLSEEPAHVGPWNELYWRCQVCGALECLRDDVGELADRARAA